MSATEAEMSFVAVAAQTLRGDAGGCCAPGSCAKTVRLVVGRSTLPCRASLAETPVGAAPAASAPAARVAPSARKYVRRVIRAGMKLSLQHQGMQKSIVRFGHHAL
jgi:hypothetical protein